MRLLTTTCLGSTGLITAALLTIGCGPSRSETPAPDASVTASDVTMASDAPPAADAPRGTDAQPGADVQPRTDAQADPAADVVVVGADVPTPVDMHDAGAPGPTVQLANAPGCDATDSIGADYSEFGEWLAVRLTPPSTPFVVTAVNYQLIGNDFCGTDVAHRIEVYAGAGPTPPASPMVAAMVSAPSGENLTLRRVSVTLPTPVRIAAGQDVFVAIEMPSQLCVGACRTRAGDVSRNWWSNAIATPYPWSMLSSFSIDSDAIVEATGHTE